MHSCPPLILPLLILAPAGDAGRAPAARHAPGEGPHALRGREVEPAKPSSGRHAVSAVRESGPDCVGPPAKTRRAEAGR
ncbi:hypothetical protein THAOC_19147, partial [Thalassiosira oceanica]